MTYASLKSHTHWRIWLIIMTCFFQDVRDLLNTNSKEELRVRNNFDNEIVIDNLSEHTITSYENVMELLKNGISMF